LEAQDGPQARDVAGRVEPVAARRAPGRQQLLVLEVADLRDGDVGELQREVLADRSDRHALRRAGGERPLWGLCRRAGHPRERKVSLYLPIWSSSPSASWCESTRWRFTYV